MTRCTFCRRRSAYDYEDIRLCIPCGLAYREGHLRGIIDESIKRREEKREEGKRMTGLKPCPFCGSENIGRCSIGLGATGLPEYMVYCKECKGAVRYVIPSDPSTTYVLDATKMWNRRVSE